MNKKAKNRKVAPKKAAKAEPKALTMIDRLPKNRGELLEIMIRLTDRAITNPSYQAYLVDQSNRLKAELEAWKLANTK